MDNRQFLVFNAKFHFPFFIVALVISQMVTIIYNQMREADTAWPLVWNKGPIEIKVKHAMLDIVFF